jgi:hypothetical protein
LMGKGATTWKSELCEKKYLLSVERSGLKIYIVNVFHFINAILLLASSLA